LQRPPLSVPQLSDASIELRKLALTLEQPPRCQGRHEHDRIAGRLVASTVWSSEVVGS
jgi:hypothetical protein